MSLKTSCCQGINMITSCLPPQDLVFTLSSSPHCRINILLVQAIIGSQTHLSLVPVRALTCLSRLAEQAQALLQQCKLANKGVSQVLAKPKR